MKKGMLNFTITGFIIGMILIAMFASVFAMFVSEMNAEYNMSTNNSFGKYENYTDQLYYNVSDIKDKTDISSDPSITDVLGSMFSGGYAALKTSVASFKLFDVMMDDAAEDIEQSSTGGTASYNIFKDYLWMIIVVALFVGVLVMVLVKMRI